MPVQETYKKTGLRTCLDKAKVLIYEYLANTEYTICEHNNTINNNKNYITIFTNVYVC